MTDSSKKGTDLSLLRQMARFVRPQWALFLAAFAMVPVLIAGDLTLPYLLKIAIDDNIGNRSMDGLGMLAGLSFGIVVVQLVSQVCQLYVLQLAGQRAMLRLRQELYRHLLDRSAAFYDKTPMGRLMTGMTSDVESLAQTFNTGLITFIFSVIRAVSILVMMTVLSLRLMLIIAATLPVVIPLVAYARRVVRYASEVMRIKATEMNSFIIERLNGIRVVQIFCREAHELRLYNEAAEGYRNANLRMVRGGAATTVMDSVAAIAGACVAWYTGANLGEGLTVGLVVLFVQYIHKLFAPARDLSGVVTMVQTALAGMARISELLDQGKRDAPVSEAATPRQERADAPAIELRGVRFSYHPDKPVLKGVDLLVPRGSTVAVVGATGSGKSSLIRLVARFYEPDEGQLLVFGRDVQSWPARELRSRLTVVSQDVFLFRGTIAENVRLGRLEATDEEVEQALASVGADVVLKRRGMTREGELVERGKNLSAGERQLITFARALVRDPEILILDEATANIDPEAEAAIEVGVRTLMEGRTTLVIAHRLSTIRNADIIFVMSDGQIVEAGTRDELVARDGEYAKLERMFQETTTPT